MSGILFLIVAVGIGASLIGQSWLFWQAYRDERAADATPDVRQWAFIARSRRWDAGSRFVVGACVFTGAWLARFHSSWATPMLAESICVAMSLLLVSQTSRTILLSRRMWRQTSKERRA